jgi:hypothetical protein
MVGFGIYRLLFAVEDALNQFFDHGAMNGGLTRRIITQTRCSGPKT